MLFIRVFPANDVGTLRKLATFDEASTALARLPQCLVEPDGSFVASGEDENGRWQLEGQLMDGGPALQYVELRGQCSPEALQTVLQCFANDQPLIIELAETGEMLDQAAFMERCLKAN